MLREVGAKLREDGAKLREVDGATWMRAGATLRGSTRMRSGALWRGTLDQEEGRGALRCTGSPVKAWRVLAGRRGELL